MKKSLLRLIESSIYFAFPGNIAYRKPTQQSGAWSGLVSSHGVDGYLDSGNNGNCAHPENQNGEKAWFYVDLEGIHQIFNVTIYNTVDESGILKCILVFAPLLIL